MREAFPELEHVSEERLREGVVDVWAAAMANADLDELGAVPWYPPAQRALGIEDATLVDHVRDVARGALALAEVVTERRDLAVDVDLLVAGALVHDVSTLGEFDGMTGTRVGELLGHPYYGVHLIAAAGLPVTLAHVVLSHSRRTPVQPAFVEAALVRRADEAAAAAIRATAVDDLRNA